MRSHVSDYKKICFYPVYFNNHVKVLNIKDNLRQPFSFQFDAYFRFQTVKTQVLAQPRVHFIRFFISRSIYLWYQMKMNKIELDEYLTRFNETYHVNYCHLHCSLFQHRVYWPSSHFPLDFIYVLFTPLRTSMHICSSLLFAKLSENPE